MPMTPEERKAALGSVRYVDIAAETGRSVGQVSQVMNDKARDGVLEHAIAAHIGRPVVDVFTEWSPDARRERHVARFWSRVQKGVGCWTWTGSVNRRNGYGKLRFLDTIVSAHRLSYELAFGPPSIGALVCHTCDNPRCVNPAHLYLGSALTNNHDTRARGRRPRVYTTRRDVERSTLRVA